jgi:hypothetical protein
MRVAFLSLNVYTLSDSYLLVSILVKYDIYPVRFNSTLDPPVYS